MNVSCILLWLDEFHNLGLVTINQRFFKKKTKKTSVLVTYCNTMSKSPVFPLLELIYDTLYMIHTIVVTKQSVLSSHSKLYSANQQ